jgi:hypothetical protein
MCLADRSGKSLGWTFQSISRRCSLVSRRNRLAGWSWFKNPKIPSPVTAVVLLSVHLWTNKGTLVNFSQDLRIRASHGQFQAPLSNDIWQPCLSGRSGHNHKTTLTRIRVVFLHPSPETGYPVQWGVSRHLRWQADRYYAILHCVTTNKFSQVGRVPMTYEVSFML